MEIPVRVFEKGREVIPSPDPPIQISDEEVADRAEAAVLAKVDTIIDAISTLADAKVFLKRLCQRLITKGYLP